MTRTELTAVLTVAFGVLLAAGMVGTGMFALLYWRRSAWRDSPVGRHLLAYACCLCVLYLLALAGFVVHSLWMAVVVLPAHTIMDSLIWQRVVLLVRAQREDRAIAERAEQGGG